MFKGINDAYTHVYKCPHTACGHRFQYKPQLDRHVPKCPKVFEQLRSFLTNTILDTSLKPLLEVASDLLTRLGISHLYKIEEWVYFESDCAFRTEDKYAGSNTGTVIRIGKIHHPDHYILLDTSINQASPWDKLHTRSRSQLYHTGVVKLIDSSDTTSVAQVIDKGQYPWGDQSNDCKLLGLICESLDIHTDSGVRNSCTYTHIIYGLLKTPGGTKIIKDLIQSLHRPEQEKSPADLLSEQSHMEVPDTLDLDNDTPEQPQKSAPPVGSQMPPLPKFSTLYQEYHYPEELQTDSPYFPFDSKADAIIYMWDAPCVSNRLTHDRLTLLLQSLPLLGVQGLTCETAQSFRDKYDARFPLMKMNYVSTFRNIRQNRKTKAKSKAASQSDAYETGEPTSIKVKVPYFCPDEFVIRAMADPIWSRTLRFGIEKLTSAQKISQFNQTPYAREMLRWSQMNSIDRFDEATGVNDPIVVGSWYIFATEEGTACLIKKLMYQGGEIRREDESSLDWWPLLHVEVDLCTMQLDTKINRHKIHAPQDNRTTIINADELRHSLTVFRGNVFQFSTLTDDERKKYSAYLYDWSPSQIPEEMQFQYPDVINGSYFIFLSWYLDSFKATRSGKKSIEGLYQTILNVDARLRSIGETYKTLALIEPGVDPGDVFRAITDSSKLRSGIKCYDVCSDNSIDMKGTLALAPADLHQLSSQCRHGGSNSEHNCPNCCVIKEDRTNPDIQLTNYDITRTRSQTDKIVEICLKWIQSDANRRGVPVPKSVIEDIRREFGVKLQPSWYEGWEYDEHRQGFRDAEHLFYYGIFREQMSVLTDAMSSSQRETFIARIDSFKWPDGMPELSFDFNPKRGKKRWGTDVSMTMYKQLFVAVLFVLEGITTTQCYKHFARLWLWHLKILDNHNSVDDIPELQKEGITIVKEGARIMSEVYDRPNGHGLIEMITRTLPALVYIRLVTSGNFERHHQLTKRMNPSRHFVVDAMKSFNVIDTLRSLIHGTRWGPNREYILGHGLRTLKDPQDPRMPHKLIAAITSAQLDPVLVDDKLDLYHYHDDWLPYNYKYQEKNNHPVTAMPDSSTLTSILNELARLEEKVDVDKCKWRWPKSLRKFFTHGDHRIIRQGHTVLCKWEDKEYVAKIHSIIELRYTPIPRKTGRPKKVRRVTDILRGCPVTVRKLGTEWRIVFIQVRYYTHLGRRSRTTQVKMHPIRKTRLMSLNDKVDDQVFTCGHLVRQLLPVHSCHWRPPQISSSHCCGTNTSYCHVKSVCVLHRHENCTEYTCADKSTYIHRVQHNTDHKHFELADEDHGIYFDETKRLEHFVFSDIHRQYENEIDTGDKTVSLSRS